MSRAEKVLKYFNQNKEYVDARINSGIELNRKGTVKLCIKDKEGNVLEGAKVKVVQREHEFKHGANIFMLDEFENEGKNKTYREKFKEVFNLATIPFYWSDLEPIQGQPRYSIDSPKIYRRPAVDLCLDYCKENGIEPKCHCLNYDNFTPDWAKGNITVENQKELLEKRFKELAHRYASIIPSWEVTNETFRNDWKTSTKFYREDDFVSWSFRMADRYFPLNKLIINDYYIWDNTRFLGNRSAYYMQVEHLLKNDKITHLDSIGMQFHIFLDYEGEEKLAFERYNPMHIFDVFDTYAKLGKKIQITEMTIPALSNSEEDEAVQAELIKNFYTLFFSHPAMEAIIYWNLVDGYAAFAPQGDMTAGENRFRGGLMRFDMSEKPAFKVLKDLFAKEWHTEAESFSDIGGMTEIRGFYGDYDLTVIHNGQEYKKDFKLIENNDIIDITL